MSLIRAATTVGGYTMISRVAGFTRDVLLARFLGASFASDAFLVAFRLPNLFRSLFAEGAFSAAFVPMVAGKLSKGGDGGLPAAVRFTEQALAFLLPILALFTIGMLFAAVPAVWVMTGGFQDGSPEKLAITADFARLAFPYLLLVSLVSLLGGLLNALDRFWVPAAAPILLNIVLITCLLSFQAEDPVQQARNLAAAVSVAGIVQFLFVAWGCHRAGARPRLRLPKPSAEIRTLLRRIGPAAIGAGAVQINLLVSTMLAAHFLEQGSVSYLYYADRLNQLPLGIIGVGVGVALLPTMSRLLAGGDREAAIHQQNRAIEFALLLTIPAAFALTVAAEPIIRILFQQGAFTDDSARKSAHALMAFATGLPAYILIKVMTPAFHARGDTRTPMQVAIFAIAVNLVGNLILIWPFRHVGIAIATSLSAWTNLGVLYYILRRRAHFHTDGALRHSLPRMAGAAALMAAILFAVVPVILPYASGAFGARAVALGALVGVGGVTYFGAGFLFGAYSPARLRQSLRRDRS